MSELAPNRMIKRKKGSMKEVQVSSKYKMCSTVFEPPPTAQMQYAKDFKFCMETPQGSRLLTTEAIFDKLPLSRDLRGAWGTPRGAKNSHNFDSHFSNFFAVFS